MNEIDKISYNTRSTECNDLCGSIAHVVEESPLNDPHLSGLLSEIKAGNETLLSSIKQDRAESHLEELDHQRDDVYRSLLYLTKGYVHHPDTQIRESAEHVDEVINKYGFELISASYSAESALLDSFLKDMARPELAPAIELLPGIKDLRENLGDKQNDFKSAERDWLNARAKEQSSVNATKAKKDLLKIVNDKLIVYLRGMLRVQPDQYASLVSTINLLIETNNGIVKRRSHQKDLE